MYPSFPIHYFLSDPSSSDSSLLFSLPAGKGLSVKGLTFPRACGGDAIYNCVFQESHKLVCYQFCG